ncbi:hypothetical protein D3F03_00815 [Simplicispira hankyongi]|uniref:Uncharacterized protein n=1 Tax=Simplicispira hankyongi TaxID=2315688 RepID=A0A398CFY1_9BURK|nr:hypothetical protein D3F03_00815 [Simplicispira hankyongi]
MPWAPSAWRNETPPVALRAFPLLSPGCVMRKGGRHQRSGAALARWPLIGRERPTKSPQQAFCISL